MSDSAAGGPTDAITAETILRVMKAMRDTKPRPPCPHVVHPQYARMERVLADALPTDHITACAALCGAVLVFREVRP